MLPLPIFCGFPDLPRASALFVTTDCIVVCSDELNVVIVVVVFTLNRYS